ncbi:MAG: NAD-dependent epimerase/dehydratase family protein [Anaerolineaceae bacterium]
MRYLILGGAGFLGTWTAHSLLSNKSNSVVVFDKENSNFSRLSNMNNNLEIRKGNFCVYENFEELLEGCNVVFHLVSTTNPSTSNNNIDKEVEENILPSIRLLEACVKQQVGKIVFYSSGGTVYGKQVDLSPIKESNPTNPICSYGVQKLIIEKYIQVYGHVSGLDYRIIRLSNPFGPYQNPIGGQGVLAAFAYRIVNDLPVTIYGDGDVIRDFIDVRDAIGMVMRIVENEKSDKLYNVGSGIGYSINECLALIENAVGKKAKINREASRRVDVNVNILDISKYLSEISPVKPRDIRNGIRLLVDYYNNLLRIDDKTQINYY